MADWAAARSPLTLKALAVFLVIVALLCALAWVKLQERDKRDISLPSAASEAAPSMRASPGAEPDRLASLVEQAPAITATPAPSIAVAPAPLSNRAEPAVDHAPPPAPEPLRQQEPAAKPGPTPPAPPRANWAGAHLSPIALGAAQATMASVPTLPPAATPVATPVVAPVVAAVAPSPVPKPEPALPSAAEVDALIARFAQIYESGDAGAFAGLMDPGAMRDAQMASTVAGFVRVFHQTSRRRIELKEVQRSAYGEGTRVQLLARATIVGKDDVSREDVGQLTLVIRKADNAAVIERLEYRT